MRNKQGWGRFKIIYLLFTLAVCILPTAANAQDGLSDCGDQNNPFDTACPLDTWVVALVVIAGVFAVMHLYRKQKTLRNI